MPENSPYYGSEHITLNEILKEKLVDLEFSDELNDVLTKIGNVIDENIDPNKISEKIKNSYDDYVSIIPGVGGECRPVILAIGSDTDIYGLEYAPLKVARELRSALIQCNSNCNHSNIQVAIVCLPKKFMNDVIEESYQDFLSHLNQRRLKAVLFCSIDAGTSCWSYMRQSHERQDLINTLNDQFVWMKTTSKDNRGNLYQLLITLETLKIFPNPPTKLEKVYFSEKNYTGQPHNFNNVIGFGHTDNNVQPEIKINFKNNQWFARIPIKLNNRSPHFSVVLPEYLSRTNQLNNLNIIRGTDDKNHNKYCISDIQDFISYPYRFLDRHKLHNLLN